MKLRNLTRGLAGAIALSAVLIFSCEDPSGSSLSSAKAITSFGFADQAADGVIDSTDRTITVTVPYGTDTTSLEPTIAHTGASISPESGAAQDFSSAVTYTVTADDNSAAEYTVTVTAADETTVADLLDLTIQLGEDERAMNFCWFSNDTTSTSAIVQIAPKSAMTGYSFPESDATVFTGTATEVEITESSNDGPPSGGPTSTASTTATEEDDSEEADTYLSCEVCADGLALNTEYVYRVGDGTAFSDTGSFTTGGSDSFSFIFVGDPQIGASHDVDSDQAGWEGTVTAAISSWDSDFILSAGDQVESSTSEEQYAAFFSAGELSSVPFMNCMGNHDSNALYQHHFNAPNESEDYGVTEDSDSNYVGGDYWFTYGKALFMVLNTNNTSTTTHQTFMEEAISDAGSDITWKFVIFHHSIYSTARHAEDSDILTRREYLSEAMDDNGIDVVLMGHDHVYCRSYQLIDGVAQTTTTQTIDDVEYAVDPAGTLYVTANSASGSKYYDLLDADAWTEDNTYRAVYSQDEEPTYSHVEVTDTTFTITTYTSDDNTVIDTYSISKS